MFKTNLMQKFNNQCSVSDIENKPFLYSFMDINQKNTCHKPLRKWLGISNTNNIQIVN